ncbi:hypothetical protein KUTeg_020438 [Tegillarca granosa]|uniref:EGF-like domain-containing protein n=1 Tax=Tegillarca granosa TaxID=220873 RepID=A0ABQ9EC95_TEGGR|nr:hypothetical protein KUTeg_020438 [Tegillarca granosa]
MVTLRNSVFSKNNISKVIFALLCVLNFLTVKIFATTKCDVCKDMVKRFNEGLETTKKSNFGGGNTNWESKTLGTYKTSETRLVEIIDNHLCQENKECHMMLEEHEELLEKYYFTIYAKHLSTQDMHEWFCIENVKACCPNNTYGPKCSPCTGGTERPCMGNGECDGAGTEQGSGRCTCDRPYNGETCESCQLGYYEAYRNTTHVICEKCHHRCRVCSKEGPSGCIHCREGYTKSSDGECIDVDECTREKLDCGHNTYCVNTEGSYDCRACDDGCDTCTGPGPDKCIECRADHYLDEDKICKKCDDACWGCTGPTTEDCKTCKSGYELVDNKCTDIDECTTQKDLCTGGNVDCVNSPGSYTCQCHKGYEMQDNVCVVKPKDKPKTKASSSKTRKKSSKKDVPNLYQFLGVIGLFIIVAKIVYKNMFLLGVVVSLLSVYVYWFADQFDQMYRK